MRQPIQGMLYLEERVDWIPRVPPKHRKPRRASKTWRNLSGLKVGHLLNIEKRKASSNTVCVVCGRQFNSRSCTRVTCSNHCRMLWLRGKPSWRKGKISKTKEYTCVWCGKPNVKPLHYLSDKYCNSACYFAHRRATAASSEIQRNSKLVVSWRRQVFERDNFTCQHCGTKGGNLHAHHIKEWSKFPELRIEVSNGLTLCISCHDKHHGHKTARSV